MKKFILIKMFFLTGFLALSASQQKEFEAAEKSYKAGQYEDALSKYQAIEKQGYKGKELYFNMGNCFFKSGAQGMAIAYYEKALKYDPADEDIRFNLRFVDKVNDEEKGLGAWFTRFMYIMPADKWASLGLLMWIVAFAGFMLLKFNIVSRTFMPRIMSWVFLCLGVMVLATGYMQYSRFNRHDKAIIISPVVQVKSVPAENGKNLYDVKEGLKVDVHNENENWIEISINSDNYGWVKKEDAEVI